MDDLDVIDCAWRTEEANNAIVLWNTVYLERAIGALGEHGIAIEDESLAHLSPIGWEHVNLTGDYTWRPSATLGSDGYRPLRSAPEASP